MLEFIQNPAVTAIAGAAVTVASLLGLQKITPDLMARWFSQRDREAAEEAAANQAEETRLLEREKLIVEREMSLYKLGEELREELRKDRSDMREQMMAQGESLQGVIDGLRRKVDDCHKERAELAGKVEAFRDVVIQVLTSRGEEGRIAQIIPG